MKKTIFEAEVKSRSLSSETAGVKLLCDRARHPRMEWFASSGESLWTTVEPDSFKRLEFFSERSTGLRKNAESSISTLEHLTPVLLMYPQSYFEIRALSKELPILDGSSYPWYEAVRTIAGLPQDLVFYDAPIRERFDWGYGFMEVSPAESLEIEYSISHGSYADDAYVEIYEAEDLVKLFTARTFIFEEDFEKARAAGLLSAADASCGLLLREEAGKAVPVTGGKFCMPSEPVKHKILDLIGDLALPAPFLPRLRIRIHNGGHVAHRKLLERLLDYAFRNTPQVD
ncbi:MAG: UDP-3-O-acyl-N-acetylglucosamine deacetylase [Fibrobacter sp.]|nr:UDP-3-O-acyl-N-acetylglucosamine deacetylase [Fibrobacter sp.]